MNRFVGEFHLESSVLAALSEGTVSPKQGGLLPPAAMPGTVFESLLSLSECEALRRAVPAESWVPVGRNGYLKDYAPGDPIGSWRASCYSESLADVLWARLSHCFARPIDAACTQTLPAEGHRFWKAVGLNPLMRYIRYEPQGLLVPHFDGPFIWDENKRTLMSLVIYLTDSVGGATRFLKDAEQEAPASTRDYGDWTRTAKDTEILCVVPSCAGRAIAFNHLLLHDGEKLPLHGSKTIIRTDIAFEKC